MSDRLASYIQRVNPWLPKVFATELRVFERHKEEWLKSYSGEFVVIASLSVAGPDYQSAFRAGLQKFGPSGDFLVKPVCAEEPVYLIF